MRRLPLVAAVAALAGAAVLGAWLRSGVHGRRPDIVVLLWDTTRADRLSASGYGRPTTPWLESLAARGVLYEQCRAPAPWTLPSHASIFTGLLPSHHGAVDVTTRLASSHTTLAERLRDAGYDTVLISNNAIVGPLTGLARGFDEFVLVPERTRRPPSAADTVGLLEEALRRRRRDPARAGKPLFLFVNLLDPHLPHDPPVEVERPWRPPGVTEEQVARAKAVQFPMDMQHNLGVRPLDRTTLSLLPGLYDAEIRVLDGECARMEKALAEDGVLAEGADALLAVTSDHGENLGEHGLVDHKLSTAETLLHVPLVIRWPGRLDGGRRVKEQVRLQDLFPTLLEVARVPFDAAATPHAASLLASPLADRAQVSEFPAPRSFEAMMRRTPGFEGQPEAVFAPFRVGILATTAPLEGGRRLKWERSTRTAADGTRSAIGERLFDLAADPGEERDLLAASPPAPADLEAARRLAATADAWTAPR